MSYFLSVCRCVFIRWGWHGCGSPFAIAFTAFWNQHWGNGQGTDWVTEWFTNLRLIDPHTHTDGEDHGWAWNWIECQCENGVWANHGVRYGVMCHCRNTLDRPTNQTRYFFFDINQARCWSNQSNAGTKLTPLYGPQHTGLTNLGNTCDLKMHAFPLAYQ